MQDVIAKLAELEREVKELRENQSRLYVDLPGGTTVLARVCTDTRDTRVCTDARDDYAIVDADALCDYA